MGWNPGRILRLHSGRRANEAFLAVFLDFRDGKIIKQRNYDCYESW